MKYNFDALIIGGGASGLMCAATAKKRSPKLNIAVIEKNDRVGKKLLSTGNGRCNLTNIDIAPQKYVGSLNCARLFEQYDAEFLLKEFESLGLLTSADSEGRVYPVSRQASSVLDVLRFACDRTGVEIFCGEQIRTLKRENGGFKIKTAENEFLCKKLVIACGSKAAPKLGGSASSADYLRNFGLAAEPFRPALCPVQVRSEVLKSLKGLRAAGKVSLLRNGRIVKTEKGEIQFADSALSGICVFNLSLYAKSNDIISIDLLPDYSEKELYIILSKNKELFKNLTSDNLMTGILQKRLSQMVMKLSGVRDFSRSCGDLSESEIKKTVRTIKSMDFAVTQLSGFDQAQCAGGGVKGNELKDTFESKKVRNLFVCGETVDICGECGGFNLHFAFVSGFIVGEQL